MDALILGAHEIQAHAVATTTQMAAHIELARGLVFVAIVTLVLVALFDLAMPSEGPRR